MNRDGYLKSLWQKDTSDYTTAENFSADQTYDVAIVGGGITGISTALQLQKAGKKCVVIEAHNLGFGTTGGTTAHINTFFDTPYSRIIKNFNKDDALMVARSARRAIDLIKTNISQYNIDCNFKELPGYLFSINEQQSKELEQIVEDCKQVGVKANIINTTILPIPYLKIAIFENQAQFNPIDYLYGMAKAFEDLGGAIIQNNRVLNTDENSVIDIETEKGIIKASNLVYATHVPPGVNLLHFRCAPYRSYAMAVKLNNEKDYPDAVAYDMNDPYHYYRTQMVDGESYFIVGGEDHKTAHEENTESRFRRLESHIRSYFNIKEVSYKWSSQYFESTDGIAYIGNLPAHRDNVYVATGFGGNGMLYGSFSALLLTELILHGSSEYGELFDPNRIKPVAGFANFVKESADVVGKLIGGLFSADEMESLSNLAHNEGKVVEYNGKKMGLYKNEQGKLFAVNTACTHINCEVQFNNAEKSWDCPCHGSRFSITGDVLTAPARKNLEVLNLADYKQEE